MGYSFVQCLKGKWRLRAAVISVILLTILGMAIQRGRNGSPGNVAAEQSRSAPNKRWIRSSQYITVRDGTRLAADVFRPTNESGTALSAPLPVVWTYDRYYRAKIEEENFATKLDAIPWLRTLLAQGYVVVAVDARGAGASFGRWDGPFSQNEAQDVFDITEWLARQPWSDGKIGMFGHSYMAVMQLIAAGMNPPHLRAIFPEMPLFDLYNAVYTGGIFREQFALQWSNGLVETDKAGIAAPVDGDPDGVLLMRARLIHRLNPNIYEMLRDMPYRDSIHRQSRSRLYLSRDPARFIKSISKSKIGVYQLSGWYDLWAKDAFLWHANLDNPRKLIIGPWSHGVRSGFDIAGEHLRWYDYFLKGIQNGVLEEPPIRYYTLNAPAGKEWRTSSTWPPAEARPVQLYFHKGRSSTVNSVNDGRLSTEPPLDPGVDEYVVDYTTSSGVGSRWNFTAEEPATYREMAANDSRGLTYTSEPLAADIEITGHPILNLWLSSKTDVNIFAYLEEIYGNGFSRYVTEGAIRGSQRLNSLAPANYLGLPYHRGLRKDIKNSGLTSDQVVLDLMPISNVFQAGSRIRITITGADRDNAYTSSVVPAPMLLVHHGPGKSSYVTLPIIRGNISTLENIRLQTTGTVDSQNSFLAKLAFIAAISLIAVWIIRGMAIAKKRNLTSPESAAERLDRVRAAETSNKEDA